MNRKLNLTLLYVEDEVDTREKLTEVFKHKVKKLYVAKDGIEALDIFKNNYIHLVISDYKMPKMNGNELCKGIKKINQLVTFILLTAFNDSELLIESIEAGVDKFLQKPVESKKLFGLLNSIDESITNRFELEKSVVCLQEVEKIALLSYWSVNLKDGTISFSKEAFNLFDIDTKLDSPLVYQTFATKVRDSDKFKFLDIFERRVFTDDFIDDMIVIKDKNSKERYIHTVTKKWKSSVCGVKHVIGFFQDISSFELERLTILKDTQLDPVLKIANKRYISNELSVLINSSRRYGHSIGVLFFDIDNFKSINENYGHLKADDILLELAELIKNSIRQSDIFGRWGGDEFVVLAPQSSPTSTMHLSDKILKIVNSHTWKHGINLTISIGLAFYEADDDVQSLLNRADMKMLEAKRCGKNNYKH